MPARRKWGSEPPVESHAARHLGDVGSGRFADVGDLVDERDSRRQEGIRCQLDHLGRGDIGPDDLGVERRVQRGDPLDRVVAVSADHDPVRLHEVADGRSLGEELRIRDVRNVPEAVRVELLPNRGAGSDRHGALHRQNRPLGNADGGELGHDVVNGRQIGVARIHGRGADAHEQDARRGDELGQLEREAEPLSGRPHGVLESGLVDRDDAGAQVVDPVGIHVADESVVTELGQAGACDQPDPPGSDDADILRLESHS